MLRQFEFKNPMQVPKCQVLFNFSKLYQLLFVTGYWLLVTGYWLLVTGYWLLVTGYWLLVTGYCME